MTTAKMPPWISETIGVIMVWMREHGVTEINITQEGAEWR